MNQHGISTLFEPDVIIAIVLLASLLAISLPLQVYAFRLAAASTSQTGSGVMGLLVGTASMSCCAPVLLPAVLSLIGLSGTTILSINLSIHRYFVPLALLGVLFLGYSLVSTTASLGRRCKVSPIIPNRVMEGD